MRDFLSHDKNVAPLFVRGFGCALFIFRRIARQFKEKYLDPTLSGSNLERTLFYMGEEKFGEMVSDLFKLADSYNKNK